MPLIFESCAADIARRVAARKVSRPPEIAARTDILTLALRLALGDEVAIVGTSTHPCSRRFDRRAHAGATNDALRMRWLCPLATVFRCVVCQFGATFFPDMARAFAEARRVLAPGGVFLFNAWDRIEESEFVHVVAEALATCSPKVWMVKACERLR